MSNCLSNFQKVSEFVMTEIELEKRFDEYLNKLSVEQV